MDKELAEKLVEILEDTGCGEPEIYEGYSGRGMYGKTTFGVVCDNIADLLKAVISCADEFVDEDGDPLFNPNGFKTDSMGRQVIIY